MPRKRKIFRKLARNLAKLLPTKDLEDITKSKREFETAVLNNKVKVGSFKIKKKSVSGERDKQTGERGKREKKGK